MRPAGWGIMVARPEADGRSDDEYDLTRPVRPLRRRPDDQERRWRSRDRVCRLRNVLGRGDAPGPGGGGLRIDAVRAEDGDFTQLVALLRAEADAPDGTVTADRLLLETAAATLEVTAADGRIEIRELDGEAAGRGG